MADRVDEQRYEAMITALNTFASNVYSKASEMHSIAVVGSGALGDNDEAVPIIRRDISSCVTKYAEATTEARRIANTMIEELEEQKRERQVWND